MKRIGKINGQNVEITYNEKETHFYVNGKRISKEVAFKAFRDMIIDRPVKLVASVKKDGLVTVQEMRDVLKEIENIKETKSVKEKINLLKALNEKHTFLLKFLFFNYFNRKSFGVNEKMYSKIIEKHIVKENYQVDVNKVNSLMNSLTDNNTKINFSLNKEQVSHFKMVFVNLNTFEDDQINTIFIKILTGKYKLAIPAKDIKDIIGL